MEIGWCFNAEGALMLQGSRFPFGNRPETVIRTQLDQSTVCSAPRFTGTQ